MDTNRMMTSSATDMHDSLKVTRGGNYRSTKDVHVSRLGLDGAGKKGTE